MVAVAADSSKPASELGPQDFELMPLEEIMEDYGLLVVDGEVRKGYRFRLMVRDKQGIREDLRDKLLAYKRKDLQAMVTGRELPPTFGEHEKEQCLSGVGIKLGYGHVGGLLGASGSFWWTGYACYVMVPVLGALHRR